LKRTQGQAQALTQAERECFMEKYDFKNQINDYMQVSVMFGYMTLFVVALPGSAFVVLVNKSFYYL